MDFYVKNLIRNNSKNFFEWYYSKEIINKENNESQEKKTKRDSLIEQRDRAQLTKILKGYEEEKKILENLLKKLMK